MEELIGIATIKKDGLISRNQVINNFQMADLGSGRIYKIASFSYYYKAISIRGLETTTGTVVNFFIYRGSSTQLRVKGDAFSWIEIKTNPENIGVYVKVSAGTSLSCRIEAIGADNIMNAMTEVDSFPSDAVDIPFT